MILFSSDKYSLNAAGFKRACAEAMAQVVDLKVDKSSKGTVLGECQIEIPDGARLHIDGDEVEFLNSSIEFKAASIAAPKLLSPVSPGEKTIHVSAANGIQPGHYIYAEWGLQGSASVRAAYSEHNEIVAVHPEENGGQFLELKYPIVCAVKPHRKIVYESEDRQCFLYWQYQLPLSGLKVKVNEVVLDRSAFSVTNPKGDPTTPSEPWKIRFHEPVSGLIEFSHEPVPVPIFGRGSFRLQNWFQQNKQNLGMMIHGTVPIGSCFENLRLVGTKTLDSGGWPTWNNASHLFRPFGLRMCVKKITLDGGLYGVQTGGRDSEYKNIVGTNVVAVVDQSANGERNRIENIRGSNCLNVLSGHWGGFSRIRKVKGENVRNSVLLRSVGQDSEDIGPFHAERRILNANEQLAAFSAGSSLIREPDLLFSEDDPSLMRREKLRFHKIRDAGHRVLVMSTPYAEFKDVEFGEINSDSSGLHFVDKFAISNSRVNIVNLRCAKKIELSSCAFDHLVLRTSAGKCGASISDCTIGRKTLTAEMLIRWRAQLGGAACLVDGDSRDHPVTFVGCTFVSFDVPLLHPKDRAVLDGYVTDPPDWKPQSGAKLRAIVSHNRGGYIFKDCDVRVPIRLAAGA